MKRFYMSGKTLLTIAVFFAFYQTGLTQKITKTEHPQYIKYRDSIVSGTDPDYILSYGKAVVARIYGQRKMNNINIIGDGGTDNLKFASNFQPSLGLGVSYRFLSLNFGIGVGNAPAGKGKTKSFDFQFNLYYRKWMFDIMAKSAKGMYLTEKDRGVMPSEGYDYFVNPNLRSNIFGLSAWRILNYKRFSYRAAMTQNEWQKKSAGTVLLGWEAYHGSVNANDSLVPVSVTDDFKQKGIKSFSFVKTGPGVGYAYNLVIKRNWFVSAGATYNMDFSFIRESTATTGKNRFAFQPNANFRIGAGYNNKDYNINFQYLANNYPVKGGISEGKYRQFAGNYRLSINKRLYLGKKTRKMLLPVDERMNKVDSLVQDKIIAPLNGDKKN